MHQENVLPALYRISQEWKACMDTESKPTMSLRTTIMQCLFTELEARINSAVLPANLETCIVSAFNKSSRPSVLTKRPLTLPFRTVPGDMPQTGVDQCRRSLDISPMAGQYGNSDPGGREVHGPGHTAATAPERESPGFSSFPNPLTEVAFSIAIHRP